MRIKRCLDDGRVASFVRWPWERRDNNPSPLESQHCVMDKVVREESRNGSGTLSVNKSPRRCLLSSMVGRCRNVGMTQ